MRSDSSYDLLVIGGGSAGTTAAMTAADLGKKVIVVEKDKLGGTCTNVGCVPTKVFLHGANLIRAASEAKVFGVDSERKDGFHLIKEHKDIMTLKMRDAGVAALERAGIETLKATARFKDGRAIMADGDVIESRNVLIAAGARPLLPPIEGVDSVEFLTSTTALELDDLPESIAIIGGAYIGLEFATFFNTLGVKTTVIEAFDRLAPNEDAEISDLLTRSLKNQGMDIFVDTLVKRVENSSRGIKIHAATKNDTLEIEAEKILIATGRGVDLSSLGLESALVSYGRKGIEVDDHLQTSQEGIYAAGDVVASLQLEHVAVYEGWLAANNMFSSSKKEKDYRVIPRIMFSHPEVASVGMTEDEARVDNSIEVVSFSYAAIPMAQINEDVTGVIKLIADRGSKRLLGAHIIGTDAGNLIHLAALGMVAEMPVDKIGETVAAYPSLSQGFFFACDDLGAKI